MSQKTEGVQLHVTWGRCTGNRWCLLDTVNLSSEAINVAGVYLIWRGGDGKMIYVGQGDVRDRLGRHRNDPRIQKYSESKLYVTWASVPTAKRDGVEAYLARVYNPLVGERRPDAAPISVNRPGD